MFLWLNSLLPYKWPLRKNVKLEGVIIFKHNRKNKLCLILIKYFNILFFEHIIYIYLGCLKSFRTEGWRSCLNTTLQILHSRFSSPDLAQSGYRLFGPLKEAKKGKYVFFNVMIMWKQRCIRGYGFSQKYFLSMACKSWYDTEKMKSQRKMTV